MSGIMEHLLERRSIRKFTGEPVPKDLLEQLLQAAMAAPSASNRKPWEFIVVTKPEGLQAVRQHLPFGRMDPAAIIIPCGNLLRCLPPPAHNFWIQDCSAAMQNMWLAAAGLGLGAVWVGIHPLAPFVRGVRRALALPRHIVPLGALYLGYPAEQKPARTQYDADRVHWEMFKAGAAPVDT